MEWLALVLAAVAGLSLLSGGRLGTGGGGGVAGAAESLIVPKLKIWEGFSERPYSDYAQQSIGYGSKYVAGQTPNPITRAQAEALLVSSLASTYKPGAISRLAAKGISWDSLDVGKQAAILSFVYNLGVGIIDSATWPQKFKAGNMSGAKASWIAHNKAGGQVLPALVSRRNEEWNLFERGY